MVKAKQLIAPSSSSQRKQKRRRIIRERKRGNEKQVKAPSYLPNDVVEEIFLRFPVKALIRLKSLSKQWRSTIESPSFVERHLKIAKRSHVDCPKVMVISEEHPFKGSKDNMPRPDTDISFSTICLESASLLSFTLINLPQGLFHWIIASESCDGLFCIHSPRTQSIYVVNPATRWLRQLPPAEFQISMTESSPSTLPSTSGVKSVHYLAFVKATDYKLVWLYNPNVSSPNEGVTKCEVFDFRANAWRYLTCTPSYHIFRDQAPTCANGSIYWFTEPYNGEIKVVALDIHTETFRVLPKINSAIASSDPDHIDMCTLDNALCMSKREGDTLIQNIWRLKSSEDTWEKVYTIDLLSCFSSQSQFHDGYNWRRNDLVEPCTPVAICKNKKILLSHRYARNLVKYDPQTKSLSLFFQRILSRRYVSYFPSLISHI